MNLKQGALLKNGEYRIEMVLGQGGFGITYLGVQTSLGRKVAIKEFFMKGVCERDANNSQVSISNADNKELVARYREKFLKEARSIASLEHRSIVPIIDVFECNGTAYYVMKHLGGGSLADKVKGGALPEEVAVRYICQVAEALDFVHSQRMMHLDVKPANMLLDDNGKAVLIDFGLAKQYDSEGQQTSTTPVGISHGYAPMEQYRRGGVSEFSPATDIYSLGATLYKLVIGSTPPEASDVNDDGLPALPDSISPAVRGAIEAAMQPRRKDRPQSIAEFLCKLKEQRAKSKTVSFDNIGSNRSQVATTELEPCGLRNADVVKAADKNNEETRANSSSTLRGEVSRSAGGETELSKVKTASFDDDETRVGVNPPHPSDTPPFEKVGEFSKAVVDNERERTAINSATDEAERVPAIKNRTFNVKGVDFTMVAVEGGTFKMGSNDGNKDEMPVHTVTLSDYYIGETVVTQKLWLAVMDCNLSFFKETLESPVECVSYNDCKKFISRLNKLTGEEFALPTEAQWEYAARGGNKSRGYEYSGSDNINDIAWYNDCANGNTHPVKGKLPNELGLYDMSGNVWEWCSDLYGMDYYSHSPQNNPKGSSFGKIRVLRGGSWSSSADNSRATNRAKNSPDYRLNNTGMRLVFIPKCEETRINSTSTPGGEVSRSDGDETELSNVKTEKKKSKLPLIIIILLLSVIIGVGGYLLFSGNKSSGNVGEHVGHEYVDLGLSVKWATCNVGASSPEDYGGYYAWGETAEKDNYEWSTYKWCKGSNNTMSKYCTSSSYGKVDNKTVLDRADDVAHVKWGGSWRMPTRAEQDELREKCTWTWITYKGVEGYKVIGPNGNSIFLPAAGCRDGTKVINRGSSGYYWSSSLSSYSSYSSDSAYYLYFNSGYHDWLSYYRYDGRSVRPVCDVTSTPVAKHAVSVSCGDGGNVAISGSSSTSATLATGATVTVTATLNKGCTFIGWYVNDVLVSTDVEYTFTVSEDVAFVARFKKEEINGRRYVDLGLPSGLKWATCNVGASKPEEYGGYYAWGETEKKSNYDWSIYKWRKGSDDTITKYCTEGDCGKVDNKTVLDPEDDVAHVKWGGTWRMPTEAELDELREKCTWSWSTQNGVNGYKVTGPNGNSIFLPAAGYRHGTEVNSRGSNGYYWSSSLSSYYSLDAYYLYFDSGIHDWSGDDYRYGGHSVRPVSE